MKAVILLACLSLAFGSGFYGGGGGLIGGGGSVIRTPFGALLCTCRPVCRPWEIKLAKHCILPFLPRLWDTCCVRPRFGLGYGALGGGIGGALIGGGGGGGIVVGGGGGIVIGGGGKGAY